MVGDLEVTYSLVVDEGPLFAYEGWHLAHSIIRACGAAPTDINIQCTESVDQRTRDIFRSVGFKVHDLARFADGKYCNKIAQLDNLDDQVKDVVVLLDTDTIAISDLRPWLSSDAILGKIVDAANPPLAVLQKIATAAGLDTTGKVCSTDSGDGETFEGNFNGGMYAIPSRFRTPLSIAWRRWALWLLNHIEPLRNAKKESHIDQVAFWMALRSTGLPYRLAPSNLNYFVHFAAPHLYADEARDIALIHYHNSSLDIVGKIAPPTPPKHEAARQAIERANQEIGRNFNNELFWDYRYRHWPERGSGIGSRGNNLLYKRELLRQEGIEQALSVLDVGCGDFEVLNGLRLNRYVGVDVSSAAIGRARTLHPSGDFRLGLASDVPSAEFVVCLEVLIHQETASAYQHVVDYIASRTQKTLIVSGYEGNTEAIENNSMVYFHESLARSLSRTNRFSTIKRIGAHTDVTIFRCDR